ncbi:insulinase family protein [Waddlia chondrophila]|uniref:Metalloprotease n=1 Tax=Waddlia chondrophila (strain ATCC VR-1470 / WSU 86-1044) TaxID=716544 RepID=D6YUQ1_WADCW|nr:insulinase family protein [Waddlia chondrophila]ADI37862.1 Metalloprotease [Waddlia chondrophila WSU 86-1044]
MALNKIGDTYNAFKLKRLVPLPEINCLLREIEHEPSGAKVLHIENNDPENVFCLSFRTIPETSNGVAHILEHTVLCGSKKFPVKDPFFSMTRRSLNTFMNAFTGDDFTCYPAASQVPQDFYNLLEVYLDAVFHPNLKEYSFLQEGHRLEFSIPEDPSSPLEYKGIVYNEMKGAMASPDQRLYNAIDHALFPDLTYSVNSGGDPMVIPELTYEELKAFHSKFYHPSRCLFYFYGNLPVERHLDFIQKNILSGVEKVEPIPHLSRQKRFQEEKSKEIGYPFSRDEDPSEQAMAAFGWLTCGILEQETTLALEIITLVLFGTDAAPLKKALLKSGLCKQVFASVGDDNSEIPVSIVVKGCNPDNIQKLKILIKEKLQEIAEQGLSDTLIQSALHQVEFHRSEITGDHYPYGLSLFLRCGLLMQHGGNPESSLLVHSLCDDLLAKLKKNPRYLSELITKHFIHNPHFVSILAAPDPELNNKERELEEKKLKEKEIALDDSQKEFLVKRAAELSAFQKEQEEINIDILPKISLKDVPKNSMNFPLEQEAFNNFTLYHHDCFTNEIIYSDLVFPLPRIEEQELPFLRLFTLLLPQLGCGGRSYIENLEYIQAHTGGISVSETLNAQISDPSLLDPYLTIEGKALKRNQGKLFKLLREMTTSTDFTDASRIKEVLVKHFTGMQSKFTQNALRYAMGLSTSPFSPANRINQVMGGLTYYHFLKELMENLDSRLESLITSLQSLQNRLLGAGSPHLVLSCSASDYEALKKEHCYGLCEIETKEAAHWITNHQIPKVESQGRIIASPVAFTSTATRSIPYKHPDTPAITAAAKMFDNLILHPQIREKGGAYGAGAINHATQGTFTFYTYRDPCIASSLDAFALSVQKIAEGSFSEEDLEEAKLEIIQGLDSPISPGSRAYTAYSWLRSGKSLEIRQQYRNQVLSLTREQVKEAVKTHLAPQMQESVTVVFAEKELLESENRKFQSLNKPLLPIFST